MTKANNPLLERLKKASKMEYTSTMSESKIMTDIDVAPTDIPALNIALGGSITSGVQSGLTIFAGVSGTFKSVDSLFCAKAYLDKHDDAVMIFYDSEMGSSVKYFNSVGIDTDRVIHIPVTNVEELKFDIMSQLEEIKRGDHVVIVVDSIGNLASKKEVEDTLSEKSSADMTRAKQLKSLTRMITPHLNLKNIPVIMVNHVYSEIGSMYPRTIMGGGCVVAGTKIRMADGTLRNIEDVKEGEFVQTLEGSHRVTHTWNPETLENGSPECYKVTFEDGTEVICSDAHRFRKDGKWEYITNLQTSDELDSFDDNLTKITSITKVGKKEVYDISVDKVEHYILANGVASHNTGLLYSANIVILTSKSMEKSGTEQIGNNFSFTVMKSRFVREKAKIPVTVLFDGGVNKWSGLLDMALSSGHVIKPSNGWYQRVNVATGEVEEKKYRMKDTNNADFWNPILNDPTFNSWVEKTFKIANSNLLEGERESEIDSQFTANVEE